MKDIKTSSALIALIKFFNDDPVISDFINLEGKTEQELEEKVDIGSILKTARQTKGLTLSEVAAQIGTTTQIVDKIEKGGIEVNPEEVQN